MYEDIIEEIVKLTIKHIQSVKNKKKLEIFLINPLIELLWSNLKPYIIIISIIIT